MIEAILERTNAGSRVAAAARQAAAMLESREPAARARIRLRVVDAFMAEGIAEGDFAGATGYGYDDAARARYESLLARVFHAERALARLSIVSGTHAIVATLAACAAPGSTILAVAGRPYDTLHHAIVSAPHSLVAHGVRYADVPLDAALRIDEVALRDALRAERPAVVFVQRSPGYSPRPSLRIETIERIVALRDAESPHSLVIVDNCYGEFVEEREPLEVGADVLCGSLIKNLGGTLAPSGGYVIGRADVIERVAARVYAPGLGDALGPTLGFGRALIQGLWQAPLIIDECLRGLDFAAALFGQLGFAVEPLPRAPRTDIVQAIALGAPARLIAFARGLQRVLPVNARFAPEPGPVPGYVDPVIMSGGAFVGGATIELSCDAPLREPYSVYLQGGTMAEHVAMGAIAAAEAVLAAP